MKPLKDKRFNMEVALSLSYEFSLASPVLDVLISQYKDQPFLA
jgi:hypothetical protein